jgi:hypothetical protein
MGRVTSTSRQQQLLIESHVTETEVKELMCEVREVTRQIKQEVRELKPDLTPTPEGRESSILPLSESREFVELADLGCIKEEHAVLDFDEKCSQSAILSNATHDICFDTTSPDEKLSQTVKVHYGSFPPSKLVEFKVKGDAEACEQSDILTTFSDIGVLRILSPATQVEQKLSTLECQLPGGNMVDVEDVVAEPSTLGPGQDRTPESAPEDCICEEQIGTLLDTCPNLSKVTSGVSGIYKEMLDKSSVSGIETLTHSALGFGHIPPAVSGASAKILDEPSEPQFETRADLRENDLEPIFLTHSPRRAIRDDYCIKEPPDIVPKEAVDSLSNKTPKKLPIDSGLSIDILDEHCLSEHTLGNLHTPETRDKLRFAPSSMIIKEERTGLIQRMKLKLEEPQCGTDVCKNLLPTDSHDIRDSQTLFGNDEYTDFVFEVVPERELKGEYADSGQNITSRHACGFDTPAKIPRSPVDISIPSLFDNAVITKIEVQSRDLEAKCSEFITEKETPLVHVTVADVEKSLIQESHSGSTESFVHLARDLPAEEARSSSLTKMESSDLDLPVETKLQETELSVPRSTDISLTVEDVTSHTPLEDRHFLAKAKPVSAAKDVTTLTREPHMEVFMPIVSPGVFATPTFVSQTKSQVLSEEEQTLDMARRKATDFPAELSDWTVESDNLFGIAADDIIMKDDVLEVTVSTEKVSGVVSDGKLFRGESGATDVEYETGVTRSTCVCESLVSSQPVTIYDPSPSIGRHGEKDTEEASHDESSTRKESVKTKTKKKLSERQAQRENAIKKSTREPVTPSATKRADDHLIAMQRTKEHDKLSHVAEVSSSGAVSRYRGYMAPLFLGI